MKDIRQSDQFAKFMKDLGWDDKFLESSHVYLRKFPLAGYFAKIPRIGTPIPFEKLKKFRKKYKLFKLNIAPFVLASVPGSEKVKKKILSEGFSVNMSPFNPTTTIQIKLDKNLDEIFRNFTEAKRRGVRRAIKNGIIVKETGDIGSFIKIRKRQYFPTGFLLTGEMEKLWKNFYPENAALILAYSKENKPVAGVLLLFYEGVAYYWYASALKKGKKLFAPTLLVLEALKISKKRGCKIFDFEGIYDGRFPKAAESWKGFTKFKEGFGGDTVELLENFYI